jgi:hypothetical protein
VDPFVQYEHVDDSGAAEALATWTQPRRTSGRKRQASSVLVDCETDGAAQRAKKGDNDDVVAQRLIGNLQPT